MDDDAKARIARLVRVEIALEGRGGVAIAERAICRAAAEISGLTGSAVLRLVDGDGDAMDKKAASRFAALAQEKPG